MVSFSSPFLCRISGLSIVHSRTPSYFLWNRPWWPWGENSSSISHGLFLRCCVSSCMITAKDVWLQPRYPHLLMSNSYWFLFIKGKVITWSVVAERCRETDSSSGVVKMWVGIPAWPVTALVSLSKTLNHNCFVLRMGR